MLAADVSRCWKCQEALDNTAWCGRCKRQSGGSAEWSRARPVLAAARHLVSEQLQYRDTEPGRPAFQNALRMLSHAAAVWEHEGAMDRVSRVLALAVEMCSDHALGEGPVAQAWGELGLLLVHLAEDAARYEKAVTLGVDGVDGGFYTADASQEALPVGVTTSGQFVYTLASGAVVPAMCELHTPGCTVTHAPGHQTPGRHNCRVPKARKPDPGEGSGQEGPQEPPGGAFRGGGGGG